MKRFIFIFTILLSIDLYASSSYDRAVKQYQSREYSDALKSFYVSARQHNLNAYYMLGKMHEEGIGTGVNSQTAFYWYEKSAKRGHPSAQYRLARMYESGTGVIIKPKKAKAWYKKAASNGNKDAKERLAHWETKTKAEKPRQIYQDNSHEEILPSAVSVDIKKLELATRTGSSSASNAPNPTDDDNGSMFDSLMFWN